MPTIITSVMKGLIVTSQGVEFILTKEITFLSWGTWNGSLGTVFATGVECGAELTMMDVSMDTCVPNCRSDASKLINFFPTHC